MTIREKLADWISGGALSRERTKADRYLQRGLQAQSYISELRDEILEILMYVDDQKSGTAQKVAKMCRKSLTPNRD